MGRKIHRQNFVGLRKEGESFVFFYDDEDGDAVIETISRFAADPQMNLNWSDAAALIKDVALNGSANGGRHF